MADLTLMVLLLSVVSLEQTGREIEWKNRKASFVVVAVVNIIIMPSQVVERGIYMVYLLVS